MQPTAGRIRVRAIHHHGERRGARRIWRSLAARSRRRTIGSAARSAGGTGARSCCGLRRLRRDSDNRGKLFDGDIPPLPPALYGRMIPVPQGAGQRPDPSAFANELCMVHVRDVRNDRTYVKGLDSVPTFCDYTYMAGTQNVGEILLALKERSDLTLEEIAAGAGYAAKSSVQHYFSKAFSGPLAQKAAAKLANAFEGKGSPPIERAEVMTLVGEIPPTNTFGRTVFEGASVDRMAETLPIYGTALGAAKIIEGEAIEQTTLNRADIMGYAKRPVILNGVPDVYGLHVQGSSMDPAHVDGAFLVVRKGAPLSIGDDVIVYLRPRDDSDDGERADQVLVKRLVKRTAAFIELRQFTPELTFKIATQDVLRIDRVLPLKDLLS